MNVLSKFKKNPAIKAIGSNRYRRYFLSPNGYAMHNGVFETFSESRSVPGSKEFDDDVHVNEYVDRANRLFPYD
jgi:hypothetical protein